MRDDDMDPEIALKRPELVRALADGILSDSLERQTACRTGLKALGWDAGFVVEGIMDDLLLPPQQQRILRSLAAELKKLSYPDPDCYGIVLDVLCAEAAGLSRADAALDALQRCPEHEVADHCIARAAACRNEIGQCFIWLGYAMKSGTPSRASAKLVKEFAAHKNPHVRHAGETLLARVGRPSEFHGEPGSK